MIGSELLNRKHTKKYRVSGIVWDTDDGCCPDIDSYTIDVSWADLVECSTEDSFVKLLSDILAETFGFAVKSFTYEQL